jgi:hypothetical protein
MPFGQYSGSTLPTILREDPDWLFWILEKGQLYGTLAVEMEDLLRKARRIKIPKAKRKKWCVEYRHDCDGKLCGASLVRIDSHCRSRYCTRSQYFDLSYARRHRGFDKRGNKRLVHDFLRIYFGPNTRVTQRQWEAFFDDEDNCGPY